ncbi:hypothetical protein HPG69_016151 [Diceros bicornis minor]|uniref:Uncharacterized protein n=1 Tax=Diceros bicornis minor TaxID=77932 RepID=A0A7J7FHE5_DICBM|nr:hypothetical protein HPG69_016151 [Diceros bicornis minor]
MPEEGAETLMYLVLLSTDAEGPHGEFVMEKKPGRATPLGTSVAHISVHSPNKCPKGPPPSHILLPLCGGDDWGKQRHWLLHHIHAAAAGQGTESFLPPTGINGLQSICTLNDFLHKEYGGLDVLVNNTGIVFKKNFVLFYGFLPNDYYLLTLFSLPLKAPDSTSFHIKAELTMKTNFFGTRDVCMELLPLIKPQSEYDEEPKL